VADRSLLEKLKIDASLGPLPNARKNLTGLKGMG
jgi:hypothetical protein